MVLTAPDTGMQKLVSVVIVNFNGSAVLHECLTSVFAQSYRPIEVIVVDNASVDESVELIRSGFPYVTVILNRTNLGFAGGNNCGVAAAKGEFVVLLNNDTVVTEGWLPGLLGILRDDKVGLAASKVITDNVPEKFYEMNGTINYVGYNIMREFSDLSTIFFAAGTSLMFRKSEIPIPFPDEYFLYHEDVYLSWRLRLQNRAIKMSQKSIVYHRGSATTKRQAPMMVTFYQERNRLLNCLLFYERGTLIRLLPYFVVDAIAKLLLSLVTTRKSFRGIVDGYAWLWSHRGWVIGERTALQNSRKVGDDEILRLMSTKVVGSNGGFAGLINACSRFYAKLVGLKYNA